MSNPHTHIFSLISNEIYKKGKFELATDLFVNMIEKNEFDEFLTLPAYEYI